MNEHLVMHEGYVGLLLKPKPYIYLYYLYLLHYRGVDAVQVCPVTLLWLFTARDLQTQSAVLQHSQLTLVRLIAVVGETVGTTTNQTNLASKTGRAAHSSRRWTSNVHMVDCEGVARLLRGTA